MLTSAIRIIGGKWRGRKLKFPDMQELRPTPNRVRETLFNWLAPIVQNAHCLDLYAGSGALGFEALSRGADHVVFVDSNRKVIQQIESNCAILKCGDTTEIHNMIAEQYVTQSTKSFDIIFLDPPFKQNLVEPLCKLIDAHNTLKPGGYTYIETETKLALNDLPKHWEILKHKQAGKVQYLLCKN